MRKFMKKYVLNKVRALVANALKINLKNRFTHRFVVECFGPDGKKKWEVVEDNIIVNTGLNEILDKFWKGSSYTAAHYVGLMSGTPTVAAANTMASHAGWTEVVAYAASTRPVLTLGTVASQSVDNSASKASFAVNANGTVIGGPFVTTNNTKSGTTGILIGAAAFTGGNKTADNGDTLNVTVTLTASSS